MFTPDDVVCLTYDTPFFFRFSEGWVHLRGTDVPPTAVSGHQRRGPGGAHFPGHGTPTDENWPVSAVTHVEQTATAADFMVWITAVAGLSVPVVLVAVYW